MKLKEEISEHSSHNSTFFASNHTLFTRSDRCAIFSDKQYCWPAETVQMNFGKQYGVEIYEESLIGVCFSVFSIFFSPRVWIIMRYFYASSFAPFHWIFWASRTRSQERVPLKTERLFFSVPFAFPLRSLSVP